MAAAVFWVSKVEFYRTTQLVKYIKKMSLIIAIVCIGLYIYFMATERR